MFEMPALQTWRRGEHSRETAHSQVRGFHLPSVSRCENSL